MGMTITAATPLSDIHNYTAAMLEITGHSCLLVSFLWVIEKSIGTGRCNTCNNKSTLNAHLSL